MKAVVTVIGKDKVGIISKVSEELCKRSVNIEDISQTIMQDYFAMIMMVDMSKAETSLTKLSDELKEVGEAIGVVIHVQHEDIFNSMHKI